MSVKVHSLDHLVINVSDVARSAEWYRKVLGMEVKIFDPGQGKPPRTSLIFGSQKINVRPHDADKVEWFTADHETAGSDDQLKHAGRGGRASRGLRGRDRGGPGQETGRPRRAAVGLLPRSRRQFDRDFVVRGRGVALSVIASQRVARMRPMTGSAKQSRAEAKTRLLRRLRSSQ